MSFKLRIYSFHDYDDVYESGNYATYEEAEQAAKNIVHSEMISCWKPGMQADELVGLYCHFCEDPTVIPVPEGRDFFSAATYAKTIAEKICATQSAKRS